MRTARTVVPAKLVVGMAAGGLLLAGCTQSVDEASGDFCSNVDALEAELVSLGSLVDGDATVDDVEAQRDAVSDAYDNLASSGGDLDEAVSAAADDAYGSYQDAVDAIPGDASVTEAVTAYAAAAQAYVADLATIAVDAGCES